MALDNTPPTPFPPMRKAELVLRQAVHVVTGARRKSYGKPERNFETIAAMWNAHIKARLRTRFDDQTVDALGEIIKSGDVPALMVLLKSARIAETLNHTDSWRDQAGYAACGAEVNDCDLTDVVIPADSPAMPPPASLKSSGFSTITTGITSISTMSAEDDPNATH